MSLEFQDLQAQVEHVGRGREETGERVLDESLLLHIAGVEHAPSVPTRWATSGLPSTATRTTGPVITPPVSVLTDLMGGGISWPGIDKRQTSVRGDLVLDRPSRVIG